MKEERTKSFDFSIAEVQCSYELVAKNGGSSGIDRESIEDFNKDLNGNIYKIWNRMSSGSYMPPMVKQVLIPKKQGGTRPLGIPTVGDRVAQGVIKARLEPHLEQKFHSSSYGYRPGKSAHDALKACKENCLKYDWVIDLDIKGFFDNIHHEWMLKFLEYETKEKSSNLYIERWLKSKVQLQDGTIEERTKGTPQGGVISPLLSNLYLHHAFDLFMAVHYKQNPFERYADDIVVHCKSKEEAILLLQAIQTRLLRFNLDLHPEKTKIVYCKDDKRKRRHEHESFIFLSYSFQPRVLKNKTSKLFFTMFLPAISQSAKRFIRQRIRQVFNPRWTTVNSTYIADILNPRIRGWCNYYTLFMPNKMSTIYRYIDKLLRLWISHKFRVGVKKSLGKLDVLKQASKNGLFYHWRYSNY